MHRIHLYSLSAIAVVLASTAAGCQHSTLDPVSMRSMYESKIELGELDTGIYKFDVLANERRYAIALVHIEWSGARDSRRGRNELAVYREGKLIGAFKIDTSIDAIDIEVDWETLKVTGRDRNEPLTVSIDLDDCENYQNFDMLPANWSRIGLREFRIAATGSG